jgi:putative ATP-dependent endonuclease of OLD family
MSRIVNVQIRNFRGIESLNLDIDPHQRIICLIGRGDSCKTTILGALSAAFYPAHNRTFVDSDFFQSETDREIVIQLTLIDFPETFLDERRFGLFILGYDSTQRAISKNVIGEESGLTPALILRLSVNSDLEPRWEITSGDGTRAVEIKASDRAQLGGFLVTDYLDRQFTWSRSSPLSSLLKAGHSSDDSLDHGELLSAFRSAARVNTAAFENLSIITEDLSSECKQLGANVGKLSSAFDLRELTMRDGAIAVHSDGIPLRQAGKGTRRLASIAIQLMSAERGKVVLVDEIEQGLEPDRVKQLIRSLNQTSFGQFFISTHSRDVICEIGAPGIVLLVRNPRTSEIVAKGFDVNNERLKATVRACPDAFFARRVIVCEGDTEIGVCRALDKHRLSKGQSPMSFLDCAYVNGTGSNLAEYAEKISSVGLSVLVFCDSDKDEEWKVSKEELRRKGIAIIDCDPNKNIEQQLFEDLSWAGVRELAEIVGGKIYGGNHSALDESIQARISNSKDTWKNQDCDDVRRALAQAAIKKEWFKRIDRGEVLGDFLVNGESRLKPSSRMAGILCSLSNWIDRV